ncbi:MAG: LysM peptidoglycan-binding domain-containing protein [Oscillospiraceae bacterium]|jgi:spore germination protein|nr:LysM peptidoglycan-binding domain-containing protein [Oscillospiraceae bacterium]
MYIHIVKEGETIYTIAAQYGISVERLRFDNGIGAESRLVIGQALLIIIPDLTHIAKQGETLSSIAERFGVTLNTLYRNNPWLWDNNTIEPGEMLIIQLNNEKVGTLSVDGFVYPNIDKRNLDLMLPYLTRLFIFGYGFNEDGTLIPTTDEYLIERAYDFNVEPILLLSNITESGGFDSNHIKNLISDENLQNTLINNLLTTMKAKGYRGIDLDFEYIPTSMRTKYSEFVKKITDIMNYNGFSVNVDVAPKTKDNQSGLLFEAHDYEALGQNANTVFLMTYEWGYSHSEPRAVSPINEVNKVLEYAVSKIPREKIIMGIPNYAYNWTLPYVKGTTIAKSVGNLQAQNIAIENWAEIKYDEVAQTPYYTYRDENNILHEVWFEDARSIYAKLMLANQYGLERIGIWNIMRQFPQLFLLINYLFDIKKNMGNNS